MSPLKAEYLLQLVPEESLRNKKFAGLKESKWSYCELLLELFGRELWAALGFPCGLVVKNLPGMQKTQEIQVQSLGQEDPLQEDMATHSVFLPGESHGQGNLTGCRPWGRKSWTRLSN